MPDRYFHKRVRWHPNRRTGKFPDYLKLYQRYKKRTDKALYFVGLVGIRNITKLIVGGVSPFNIADQVKLPPFTLKNVRDLYSQYTKETNQPFTEDAVKKVFNETAGQPWLVNRIGTILTINIKSESHYPKLQKKMWKRRLTFFSMKKTAILIISLKRPNNTKRLL